jgi:hypothetical protein
MKKDRTRVGVLFSPANPPTMIELLAAMQASAMYAIDNFLYVVDYAHSGPPALSESAEHRCAMAKAALTAFGQLIQFADFDGAKDLVLERTRMANGKERLRSDGEDYAFRLFRYNPDERLTLVFVTGAEHCRRTDDSGRDDTMNKILLNIKQKYCGFNADLHNVLCLFIGNLPPEQANLELDDEEQKLYDQDIFSIGFMDVPMTTAPAAGKALDRALKGALENPVSPYRALIPVPVHAYLNAHSEYKQRLIQSLAN